MNDLQRIIRHVRGLSKQIDDLDRRMMASQMTGRVAAVDGNRVRVQLAEKGADGQPFLSPWVNLQEAAGATGTNMPVKVGDPVRLLSPNGEIGSQSLAIRDSHTEDAQNPASKPEELALTYGGGAIRMSDDGVTISHGSASITLSGDTIHALSALLKHNEKNVGDTHKHGAVVRGGQFTDPPEEA